MQVIISNDIVDIDDSRLIGKGGGSNVYLFGDKVIKLYRHSYSAYLSNFDKYRLESLMKLKLEHFIVPMEIVYNEFGNIAGYTMKYINGENGNCIMNLNSGFFVEQLEKIFDELDILSKENIVIDDLHVDNILVNEDGIYFIDCDGYNFKNRLDYYKNFIDSNFCVNMFLKELFFRNGFKKYDYRMEKLFDNYDLFYEKAKLFYKPNQTVKSLVKKMIRGNYK